MRGNTVCRSVNSVRVAMAQYGLTVQRGDNERPRAVSCGCEHVRAEGSPGSLMLFGLFH